MRPVSKHFKDKRFWLYVLALLFVVGVLQIIGHVYGMNTANGIGNMLIICGGIGWLIYYYFFRNKTSTKEKRAAFTLVGFFAVLTWIIVRGI